MVVGQRGKLKLLTVSHSPMGYAVHSGLLDEVEAMQHEDRHLVFNVVGIPDMHIEMGMDVELSARDTVVIGCDGLFDNLASEEIIEILRTGNLLDATRELVEQCIERMQEPAGQPPVQARRPDGHHLPPGRRAGGTTALNEARPGP